MALSLTDLEQTLAGPDGAAVRRDLRARVASIDARLRQRIADGLPRERFADWQAAADATQAALETLDGGAPAAAPSPFSR